jgi:hypothetical protein
MPKRYSSEFHRRVLDLIVLAGRWRRSPRAPNDVICRYLDPRFYSDMRRVSQAGVCLVTYSPPARSPSRSTDEPALRFPVATLQ